jgi:hypothetical protein
MASKPWARHDGVIMSISASFVRLASSAAVALAICAGVRADLHFTESVSNAGIVYAGASLIHDFTFENDGPEAIVILDARASCGCVQPQIPQGTFAAGEKGNITLEVNTLSQAPGPHAWTLNLKYRSGDEERQTQLQLNAKLLTEVTVQPAALVVLADRIARHEITLTDTLARPLEILDVRASSAKLLPRVGQATRDVQGHTTRSIGLAVADDYPDGRHDEILHIYTNEPRYREIRVPVTVIKHAQQRIAATPGQVELIAPAGQPFPSRIILVRDNQDQIIHIDQVLANDSTIHCQWAQGPGTMATVKIHADRAHLAGESFRTAIHIRIDQPVRETLTIPVTCTVR